MKMKFRYILAIGLLLAACAKEAPQQGETLRLTSSVLPFDGEPLTRTTVQGDAFAVGDRMKLKIICPFDDHVQFKGRNFFLANWSRDFDVSIPLETAETAEAAAQPAA